MVAGSGARSVPRIVGVTKSFELLAGTAWVLAGYSFHIAAAIEIDISRRMRENA